MAQAAPVTPAFGRSTLLGVALALTLALTAKVGTASLSAWGPMHGTPVSAVVVAVLLGILWRNTVGVGAATEPGLQWVLHRVLRVGIALVGLRLTLAGIASVGVVAAAIVAACIATALTTSHLVGRMLRLPSGFTTLLAVGTAVCGCTAVAAIAPALRSRPADTGLALTCVVIMGCAGMLLYPWLADTVFPGNATAAGVFLGTSIHDTSQVMGASLIYSQQFGVPDVVPVAGFTKLLRNLSMLALIPLAAWSVAHISERDPPTVGPRAPQATRARWQQVLPPFLLAFVALSVLRTAGDAAFVHSEHAAVWGTAVASLLGASDLLLVCGMTAVGLSVSLRDLRGVGWRALGAALLVAISVAACSLALTRLWLSSGS